VRAQVALGIARVGETERSMFGDVVVTFAACLHDEDGMLDTW
jgi:hypothetical protein